MFDSLKARSILILVLVAASVWVLVQKGIILGLDLQGGTNLSLEVSDPNGAMTEAQRADAIDRALQIIRNRVDELGVAEPTIQKVGTERIMVELPGASAEEQRRAKDVIQKSAFLQFQIVRPGEELQSVLPRIDRIVAQRLGGAAATPAAGGAATPGVGGIFQRAAGDSAAQGDSARADATADTAVAARPFTSKLAPTGTPGVFAVAAEDAAYVERALALPEVRALIPRSLELLWGFQPTNATPEQEAFRTLYVLEAREMISGEYLEDAQAQRDPQFNQPIVTFQFNRRGGRIFERATGEHIGDYMAIVLDDKVFSAPVIRSQIGDRGQIELGGGTIEEARDLALVLRAGALPAPIRIVEERSIGPSLGADSIENGKVAGMVGIGLVILFMILYYQLSGVFAVGALALYALYTLAMLSGVGAALTFPGIAGFLLSIGMAVDANVLVFERIREEIAAGRSVRISIAEGFRNALPAIIDSNLTTLITCLILYRFGTGPVRGFAVTLGLGLIASMFTAIFVTRTFFMAYLNRRPAATSLSI